MLVFQCWFFVLKRSYICYYIICMTAPLSNCIPEIIEHAYSAISGGIPTLRLKCPLFRLFFIFFLCLDFFYFLLNVLIIHKRAFAVILYDLQISLLVVSVVSLKNLLLLNFFRPCLSITATATID